MSSSLSCRSFRRHFSAWRDGDPTTPDADMRAHASACGRCASVTQALDVGVRVLRASELEWPISRSMRSIAP
jgi:hypothetical protein